jgi:hypothetical protein
VARRRDAPLEPPFLRGQNSYGLAQATWLVPRRGITVAGQHRNHTGFAATTPTGEYEPGKTNNTHPPGETNAVRLSRERPRSSAETGDIAGRSPGSGPSPGYSATHVDPRCPPGSRRGLFAADRNITSTAAKGAVLLRGQTQRPKVLKWPNTDAIVGYVGQASIGTVETDQWLYAFIGRNITFKDFDDLAHALTDDLNAAMTAGEITTDITIHLGGFELVAGEWTPRIWFIRNTTDLTPQGPTLGPRFIHMTPSLKQRASATVQVSAAVCDGHIFPNQRVRGVVAREARRRCRLVRPGHASPPRRMRLGRCCLGR